MSPYCPFQRRRKAHSLTCARSDLVYLAPSGVQKELMLPEHIYVLELSKQLDLKNRTYLRSPPNLKPSQCTPLFLAAFTKRNAGCCIHTHSQWAVLVTLLLEASPDAKMFEINNIEQIKAFGKGFKKTGNLGYHDTLRIPVIENTPHEEDLTEYLEEAMEKYPDTYAVLVRRHGVYVWGETVHKAKTQCERYGITRLPLLGKLLMILLVWTTCSNWRLRCASWACPGLAILPPLLEKSHHLYTAYIIRFWKDSFRSA
jgi:methylthioribulose-1-phosphate dehydratase